MVKWENKICQMNKTKNISNDFIFFAGENHFIIFR